jgi:hypothetical protein
MLGDNLGSGLSDELVGGVAARCAVPDRMQIGLRRDEDGVATGVALPSRRFDEAPDTVQRLV